MKCNIRRERHVRDIVPVQPESLHDLAIPYEITLTAKEEDFLLYDSGPELTRILIIGTQKNCNMLIPSNFWLADGTFKTAPQLFAQVYTIHALRGGPNPLQDGHLYFTSLYYYPIRPKQHALECGKVSESFVLQHLQQA
ncbi:hypothetical protein LOD99_1818 [Oopsacas minuta]|uniref:Uncharacterized protein n=1 Tax=Oopsacas minuta TaxID=111878 RepID=A0AAV7K352_9METZ|nr:hypothetical protein LOD99_1818 [Oopsacas minuta]